MNKKIIFTHIAFFSLLVSMAAQSGFCRNTEAVMPRGDQPFFIIASTNGNHSLYNTQFNSAINKVDARLANAGPNAARVSYDNTATPLPSADHPPGWWENYNEADPRHKVGEDPATSGSAGNGNMFTQIFFNAGGGGGAPFPIVTSHIVINTSHQDFDRLGNGLDVMGETTLNTGSFFQHELCHCIGLEHVIALGNDEPLMEDIHNAAENFGVDIDEDAEAGFQCIYDGMNCDQENCGSAPLALTSHFDRANNKVVLNWEMSGVDDVIGFNIYQEDSNTQMSSVNTAMIKAVAINNSFEIATASLQSGETYYLEVVDTYNARKLVKFE